MRKWFIHISFGQIARKWFKRKHREEQDFVTLATKMTASLVNARSKSTIDNYRTAISSFNDYMGKPVSLDDIDTYTFEGYERWLRGRGVSPNSISCYMRSLRSLIHKLQPEADVHQLFKGVFTGKERTEKRSLSLDDISKLQQLQLSESSPMAFARDVFLFSFYALGMPFVDIAYLRKSQIANGYIIYHRHKTGQRISIKIEPPMQQIINRYQTEDSPYVFPILSETDDHQRDLDYETARSAYNRHLKRLGEMAHTRRPLTSYVARHSWASTAYHANVSLSVISKALGHTSANTTQTYLQSIDDQGIETANRQLLDRLLAKKNKE